MLSISIYCYVNNVCNNASLLRIPNQIALPAQPILVNRFNNPFLIIRF
jgi:hypothetical protein